MRTYAQFKRKLLKRSGVKREYDALQSEFGVITSLIKRRLERGLTQRELANRVGTKQSSIARLESGTYNPSLAFLSKVSRALGARVRVI